MRKRNIALVLSILMLLCLFPAVSVAEPEEFERIPLTEENFPDANFRAWILAQDGWTEEEDGVTYLLGRVREADYIDCSGQGIADLTGIQCFPNLRYLNAGERYEENENGEWILAGANALTSFDPALTPNLVSLSIALSDVTELDVSSLTDLEELWCGGNGMTRLTLGNLPHLTFLHAGECAWYEGGETWGSKRNCLRELDLSGVPNLRELNITGNELTSLDASAFADLIHLESANNPITQLMLPDHMISGGIGLNDVEPTDNGDGTYSFDLGTILNPAVYSFDKIDTSDWTEDKTLDTETGVISFAYRPNWESICVRETVIREENRTEDLWIDLWFRMPDDLAWTVIGSIFGTSWNTDFQMIETEPGVWQSGAWALHEGEEFKVRGNCDWIYNYGMNGEPGGANCVVEADGTYVITLNLNDSVALTWELTDLEPEEPVIVQQSGDDPYNPDDLAWTVIGSIFGTGWNTDFQMIETEPGVWQSGAWALHEGEEFKVRGNCDWSFNYGMNGEPGGANCVVGADGTYIITLNLNDPVTLTWELTDREPEEPVIVQSGSGGQDDPDDPDYPYVTDEGIDPATAFNGGGEDGTPPDRRPDAPAYDGALDGIPIDAAHFPDANFREWILRTIGHETDTDAETGEETYRLTGEQRWNVTVIDCRGRHIESLAGIEYFPNLEWLYCGRKLTEYVPEYAFWLYASNPITELDLSGNPKLTRLYASYCLLTSIDLSRNPELTHLSLFHNRLTALDLSYNTKIEELSFEVNDIASLTAPEMPDLRVLRCGFTQLAAIDLNGRSALTSVRCHNIDTLETLNINGCTGLDPAECEIHDNYALRELRCRSCGLSELPGNIPNLEILDCGGNTQFTSLNLSDFRELRELYCDSCNLYRLDLSVNRKITVLNCSNNHLKELRVALVPGSTPEYGGDFSAFGQTADCTAGMVPDGGGFTFDMSRLVSAENLDRILSVENAAYDSATGIAAFEAESDTIRYTFNASEDDWIPLEMSVTVTLNVEMPELPEGAIPIDREHFPDDNFRNWILQNLTPYYTEDAFGRQYLTDERENALYFDLTGREIHTIEGLQYFPNAFGLFLGDNYLTEVDLSQNRNLVEVHLNNNRLTALDVSGLPILQWLNCSGNLLTELDVSHNANLAVLWCRDNNLNEIRLPNGTVHTYRNVRGEEWQMNQLARIECDGNGLASLDLADLPALKELSCENNNLTELSLSGSGDFGLLNCDESVDITLPEGMAFHAQMIVNDGEATYRCTSLTAAIDKITGRDGVTGPDEVQSAQITLFDDQEGPALEFAEDQQKTVVIDLDGHTYTAWSDPTILAYENDVTVINGEIVLRQRPAFRSNSLVLSGQIGVNFFMELPAIGGVDYADSYVTFTIPHGSVTERADFDPNARNAASTYYRFTAYVNAIQMAEPITATFHYVENGEEKTVENTFAIRDYLIRFDNMLEENPDVFDEQTVSLVHALADYGHYVQIFLSEHRDWEIGADYAESDRFYTDAYDIEAVRNAVGAYAISRVNETDGDLEAISYSLLLDSETAIKVYFTPSESYTGAVAATADGTACSVIGTGGRYAVVIPKISAHKLTESHTIAVTTEHGTATVTVSALSYVKGLLDYDTDADSQNAMAAIYAYSEAAQDYIATH